MAKKTAAKTKPSEIEGMNEDQASKFSDLQRSLPPSFHVTDELQQATEAESLEDFLEALSNAVSGLQDFLSQIEDVQSEAEQLQSDIEDGDTDE